MKKILFLLPLFLLSGCQAERSPEEVLPAFWNSVQVWIEDPSEDNARQVCSFLDPAALRNISGEESCLETLQANFSGEVYRVEPIRRGSWVREKPEYLRLQPVALFVQRGKKREVLQVDSAARLDPGNNWSIRSLDGLAFPALLGSKGSLTPLERALFSS